MGCTNICNSYKVSRPELGTSRYGSGQKYCSHCAVFMMIDGIRCPCCKYHLKTKSVKYRDEEKIKRI